MNKTKRFCAIALAAMTAATALAACGAQPTTSTPAASQGGSTTTTTESTGTTEVEDPLYGEGQNGEITLKVWGPDSAQAILKTQCDEFIETMKPYAPNGIKIEVVPQGEDVAATQAQTDISAAADVFGFACDNIDGLVKAGALLEVTGAEKDYVIANNSESSVAAATVNDKLMAYPETGDNSYVLIYDKTVVSDEQAKTLEGTLEACKAANKKFVMDAGNGYYSCMFMFTGGVKINGLEDDGTQKFTEYDEAKAAKTVVAFQSLFAEYKDYFMSGDASKVVDGFTSGTVGAGIDGSWDFTAVKNALGDNAGFTILPTIKVGEENLPIINMFGYKLLGVNSHSQFPNTAIELAKYLTNEKCQQERAEQLNWGPSNKAVAASDVVKNDAALSAVLAQSANSVAQSGLAGTFWTPVGTLGSKIVDFDNMMDEAAATELIKKTIANVRDE